jgi:hypothetical protein
LATADIGPLAVVESHITGVEAVLDDYEADPLH